MPTISTTGGASNMVRRPTLSHFNITSCRSHLFNWARQHSIRMRRFHATSLLRKDNLADLENVTIHNPWAIQDEWWKLTCRVAIKGRHRNRSSYRTDAQSADSSWWLKIDMATSAPTELQASIIIVTSNYEVELIGMSEKACFPS